jgi:hypothetical protein
MRWRKEYCHPLTIISRSYQSEAKQKQSSSIKDKAEAREIKNDQPVIYNIGNQDENLRDLNGKTGTH